jgi:hypothetical protein
MMLRLLKQYDQALMVGSGCLISFTIFGYIVDDHSRCEKRKLIYKYEDIIQKYKKEISVLNGTISKLEKKVELK